MKANYIIIRNSHMQVLSAEVNSWINQGYLPQGGISTTTITINSTNATFDRNGDLYLMYTQAMILEKGQI